jgi:hypothetical protein
MPLPAAHAGDLGRLEQAGLAEGLLRREFLRRLAVRDVEDEDAAEARLAVLGKQAAAEYELVLVLLEVREARVASRIARPSGRSSLYRM